MKIAMITPYYHPPVRGNAVTVRRLAGQMESAGHKVDVYALDGLAAEDILQAVRASSPDLLHAIHAHLGGRVARELSLATGIPYLLTLTGSDVYEALDDGRRMETLAALRDAAAVVAFHKCVKCRVTDHLPTLAEKTVVIPQGVELPGCDHLWGEERFDSGEFIFFLPAGLRPVKNAGFPLAPLARLHREDLCIRFLLAGPILDNSYGAELLAELDRHPFARYLGEIDRHAVGALYQRADVVLNTSLFEGGMANSVLEAMAFGKPLLASNIEGNRSLVKEGKTGLLFHGEREFQEKALELIKDASLRKRLGENGRRLVLENYTPEREAAAYCELYAKMMHGVAARF